MSPVATITRAIVRRRWVQTTAIGLVVALASLAMVAALALARASSDPLNAAFDAHHGAHVTLTFDAAAVTVDELRGTGSADGVTSYSGPFPQAQVTIPDHAHVGLGELTVVGRGSPGGSVDDLTVWAGRWAERPGEIVLAGSVGDDGFTPVGAQLELQNGETLTVVGYAFSLSRTADAWVAPQQVRAWGPRAYQMLYRIGDDPDAAAIHATEDAIASEVGSDAILGTASYENLKERALEDAHLFVPFLTAFSVLAAAVAVLIVANLVSGIVISGLRRVGVLKSLGFTPNQVLVAHLGVVGLPAVAGAVIGVVGGYLLGNGLAADALAQFGSAPTTAPWWIPAAVLVGAILVVTAAALTPSLSARRLSAAAAITAAASAHTGRGRAVQRWVGQLALPRPLTLGLGMPAARPGRSLLTMASVVTGVAVVTLAVGTTSSVVAFRDLASPHVDGRVIVSAADPLEVGPGSSYGAPALTDPQLESDIAALPGVRDVGAALHTTVSVLGSSETALVRFYRGDPGLLPAVSEGRQPRGDGEATAAAKFMTRHGFSLGDPVTIGDGDARTTVRIVGITMSTLSGEMSLTWGTLAQLDPTAQPSEYQVQLGSDADRAAFAQTLSSEHPTLFVQEPRENSSDQATAIVTGAVALTVILALVSALGVFNTVLLTVHDRRRDLGMLKSIGMTPRQVVGMFVMSTAILGAVGGVIGVPLGVAAHRILVPLVTRGAASIAREQLIGVFDWATLLALALAGLVIAVVGAIIPARRAAKIPVAAVLHDE